MARTAPAEGQGSSLSIKPLGVETWPAFADLVERHNGVWGGCWCVAFHTKSYRDPLLSHRDQKELLVRTDRAHAALVYDGLECVGWCQFGPRAELEAINRKRAYDKEAAELPDWRITCFFVDKRYRHRGVARVALRGAVAEIAGLGGGLVESFPEDVTNRKTSSSFLYNGTTAMFEEQGFERGRQIGMHHWVMTRRVPATARAGARER